MRIIDAEPMEERLNKKLEVREKISISPYTDGWCDCARYTLGEIERASIVILCKDCVYSSKVPKNKKRYCELYEKMKDHNGYCDLAKRRWERRDDERPD